MCCGSALRPSQCSTVLSSALRPSQYSAVLTLGSLPSLLHRTRIGLWLQYPRVLRPRQHRSRSCRWSTRITGASPIPQPLRPHSVAPPTSTPTPREHTRADEHSRASAERAGGLAGVFPIHTPAAGLEAARGACLEGCPLGSDAAALQRLVLPFQLQVRRRVPRGAGRPGLRCPAQPQPRSPRRAHGAALACDAGGGACGVAGDGPRAASLRAARRCMLCGCMLHVARVACCVLHLAWRSSGCRWSRRTVRRAAGAGGDGAARSAPQCAHHDGLGVDAAVEVSVDVAALRPFCCIFCCIPPALPRSTIAFFNSNARSDRRASASMLTSRAQ